MARAIVPDAVDGVSYGIPVLKVGGSPLIGVTASAKHLSVFPFSPAVIDTVRTKLDGFSLSKGTIRFTPDHPSRTTSSSKSFAHVSRRSRGSRGYLAR